MSSIAAPWGIEQRPRPIGFVLSGGASLGSVQVGMLAAAHDAGVVPDLLVGSSVGAINGVRVAADPSDAHEHLAAIWRSLRRADVFPGSLAAQARTLVRTRTHLFPPTGLAQLIRRNLSVPRFDDLALPFGAVVTDAKTGHAVTLAAGRLEPALLASAAIPGAFPTVTIDGVTYVDGGVACNVPMLQALALGAASLVVLEAGFPCHRPRPPASITESMLWASAVLIRNQRLCEAGIAAHRAPVVYMPSPCPQVVSRFAFASPVSSSAPSTSWVPRS